MVEIDGWVVPPGFRSDKCTNAPNWWPGIKLDWPFFYKIDLSPACVWHDWGRRHLVHYNCLTVQEVDAKFYRYLRRCGLWPIIGRLYWVVVKKTRGKYRKTHPVPDSNWLSYLTNR